MKIREILPFPAKKIFAVPLMFLLFFFTGAGYASDSIGDRISGDSFVLMEGKTGEVLAERNGERQLRPASTTKIMTCLLALENSAPDDYVTVGHRPPLVEGTRVYLEEGEKVKMKDLLLVMMVDSANDAALAVAEHISGTQEEFALLMNSRAAEIGCTSTHFVNSHGLDADNHYTTASDLALISSEAMKNPEFREIVSTRDYLWEGQAWVNKRYTRNKFMYYMDEATGVKSGYTTNAKNVEVASALRDGRELIAVIMGSPVKPWEDAEELLEYGFGSYSLMTVAEEDGLAFVTAVGGDEKYEAAFAGGMSFSLPNGRISDYREELEIVPDITKAVPGDVIGYKKAYLGEAFLGMVPITVREKIPADISFGMIAVFFLAGVYVLQILYRFFRVVFPRRKKRRKVYGATKTE